MMKGRGRPQQKGKELPELRTPSPPPPTKWLSEGQHYQTRLTQGAVTHGGHGPLGTGELRQR